MRSTRTQRNRAHARENAGDPTVVVYYRVFWSNTERCVRLYDKDSNFIYRGAIHVQDVQELAAFVTVIERRNTLVTFDSPTLELRLRVGSKGRRTRPLPDRRSTNNRKMTANKAPEGTARRLAVPQR